jgi:hypothetical protein
MAVKRATKSGKRVKKLRAGTLSPKTEKGVKGGSTKHPAKVTVPDIKITIR